MLFFASAPGYLVIQVLNRTMAPNKNKPHAGNIYGETYFDRFDRERERERGERKRVGKCSALLTFEGNI